MIVDGNNSTWNMSPCQCGHPFGWHMIPIGSSSSSCLKSSRGHCKEFKLDNLKYLEMKYKEKNK